MAKIMMFSESTWPRPSLVLHALLTHVLRVRYRQNNFLTTKVDSCLRVSIWSGKLGIRRFTLRLGLYKDDAICMA